MKNFLFKLSFLVLSFIFFFAQTITASNQHQSNELQKAINLGGEWFIKNQNNRFIIYEYDYASNSYSEEQHPLRETASLWSIAKLYNYTGDERYRKLADRGFEYFENYIIYQEDKDMAYLNITPDSIKLGYSAFLILTLLEIDHPKKDFYLEKLSNGILQEQNKDGSFNTLFFTKNTTSSVDYYPGEALFALMSYHEYKPSEQILEAAKRAFMYYRAYWREGKNTAFVPWQTRAYEKLYRKTGDSIYKDFVFEMNDFVIDQYDLNGQCDNFKYSGIVASVHMEGVNIAYDLANREGDDIRTECYSRFIQSTSDYILSLQQDEETTRTITVGGFYSSDTSRQLRNDRNQHSIIALIEALNFGALN